jgi:hypothetical protein
LILIIAMIGMGIGIIAGIVITTSAAITAMGEIDITRRGIITVSGIGIITGGISVCGGEGSIGCADIGQPRASWRV